VSFAAITLFVPSQRLFIVVSIYFVTDSGNFWIHPRITIQGACRVKGTFRIQEYCSLRLVTEIYGHDRCFLLTSGLCHLLALHVYISAHFSHRLSPRLEDGCCRVLRNVGIQPQLNTECNLRDFSDLTCLNHRLPLHLIYEIAFIVRLG